MRSTTATRSLTVDIAVIEIGAGGAACGERLRPCELRATWLPEDAATSMSSGRPGAMAGVLQATAWPLGGSGKSPTGGGGGGRGRPGRGPGALSGAIRLSQQPAVLPPARWSICEQNAL